MKVIEVNPTIQRIIESQEHLHYVVSSVRMGGQTMLRSGNVTFRVRLDSNVTLKKGDTVVIHPQTLEVGRV